MIAVVAAYDTDTTAVPTRLLTSTGPGVTRAWAPSEWPELAASIGDRRVVTWGGGRWLQLRVTKAVRGRSTGVMRPVH